MAPKRAKLQYQQYCHWGVGRRPPRCRRHPPPGVVIGSTQHESFTPRPCQVFQEEAKDQLPGGESDKSNDSGGTTGSTSQNGRSGTVLWSWSCHHSCCPTGGAAGWCKSKSRGECCQGGPIQPARAGSHQPHCEIYWYPDGLICPVSHLSHLHLSKYQSDITIRPTSTT